VNFPRWRKGVENSVVEITKDNQNQPIPMKNGIPGKLVAQLKIKKIGVQSVVAFENKLYVLDSPVHYLVPFAHLAFCL
jgi:hypothetical protein